jgi:hypothetical protein
MVEGVTGAVAGFLNLQAEAARPHSNAALQYKRAAAAVNALSNDLIKDHIANEEGANVSMAEKNTRAIDKLESTTRLAAQYVPDPRLREALNASISFHTSGLQFLNAYLANDETEMRKYLPATKSMLQGTLEVLKGLSTHDAKRLTGLLAEMGAAFPEVTAVAKVMSKPVVEQAEVAVALAYAGVGAWGVARGLELSAEADEIRDRQMEAAIRLRRLLPKARIEVAQAEAEEKRLAAELQTLLGNSAASQSRTVQPSQAFLDNGVGSPPSMLEAFSFFEQVDNGPKLTSGFTPEALSALEAKFRKDSTADLDRREAIRQAEAEARRLAEEARRAAERRAQQLERWSRESSRENTGGGSERASSPGREPRDNSQHLEHARAVVRSAPNVRVE